MVLAWLRPVASFESMLISLMKLIASPAIAITIPVQSGMLECGTAPRLPKSIASRGSQLVHHFASTAVHHAACGCRTPVGDCCTVCSGLAASAAPAAAAAAPLMPAPSPVAPILPAASLLHHPPPHFCVICCTCCSAWALSSANRTPTREECFMNFSQHRCTHCGRVQHIEYAIKWS